MTCSHINICDKYMCAQVPRISMQNEADNPSKKIEFKFKYGSYNMACEMVSGFNTSPTSRKDIFSNQWGQGYSNDVSRCALDSLRSIVLRRCNHDSMKV